MANEEQIKTMQNGKELPEGYKAFAHHYVGAGMASVSMIIRGPDGLARMNRMAQIYIEEDSDGAPHLFLRFWTGDSADSEEVVSMGRLV